MASFSNRLKALRADKKISQQELADIIKVSKSSVNMYERGEREPGFETLETIADYFNVDMDYLMGRQDIQRTIDVTGFFASKKSQRNSLAFNLSERECRVITAYHEQPDAQPYVDKILGIEPKEETYNIAKTAREQQSLKMTKEELKEFGDSADAAPNMARNKELF